jgi:hypothetical protein
MRNVSRQKSKKPATFWKGEPANERILSPASAFSVFFTSNIKPRASNPPTDGFAVANITCRACLLAKDFGVASAEAAASN